MFHEVRVFKSRRKIEKTDFLPGIEEKVTGKILKK